MRNRVGCIIGNPSHHMLGSSAPPAGMNSRARDADDARRDPIHRRKRRRSRGIVVVYFPGRARSRGHLHVYRRHVREERTWWTTRRRRPACARLTYSIDGRQVHAGARATTAPSAHHVPMALPASVLEYLHMSLRQIANHAHAALVTTVFNFASSKVAIY